MSPHHFVILSFPAQGHLNPNLQLSNRLIRIGVRVTFITSSYARLSVTAKPVKGLTFVEFEDGHDGRFKHGEEAERAIARSKLASSKAVRHVMSSAADEGCPVTCVAYSLLLPWVPALARELHVPSVFVWIQAATVFDVFYYYNHGFDVVVGELDGKDPSATFELPGLPLAFTRRDMPSYMFGDQMAELDAEASPAKVLINTFDALEPEALKSISETKIKFTAIGPLVPSAFLDGDDPSDTGFGGDLFQNNSNESYVSWLDSNAVSSVVYVSFGSLSSLSKQQLEEIGRGLLEFGKPFLWVVREYGDKSEDENQLISCMEELEQLGLIVCKNFMKKI